METNYAEEARKTKAKLEADLEESKSKSFILQQTFIQ